MATDQSTASKTTEKAQKIEVDLSLLKANDQSLHDQLDRVERNMCIRIEQVDEDVRFVRKRIEIIENRLWSNFIYVIGAIATLSIVIAKAGKLFSL